MLYGIGAASVAGISWLAHLSWLGARVVYYGGTNLVLPAAYHVSMFTAKLVPCVLMSGANWAATTSSGNATMAVLAASSVGYMYVRSKPSLEEEVNKCVGILNQLNSKPPFAGTTLIDDAIKTVLGPEGAKNYIKGISTKYPNETDTGKIQSFLAAITMELAQNGTLADDLNPLKIYNNEGASIWSKIFSNSQFRALVGLLASAQIYDRRIIKALYESADETLLHVPSKLASLGGTAFSSACNYAWEQSLSYINNPLKLLDLGAWAVARGGVKLADYAHNKVLSRSQALQNYAEIYGYTDIKEFKKANDIKNSLLWFEKFNLDKVSLFKDFQIQEDFGKAYKGLSDSISAFRNARTFANFKAILSTTLSTAPKYPKLLLALGVAGVSALGSGGIMGAFKAVTGLTSINKLSGILWSGPALVGILHKPLILLMNYMPIGHSVLLKFVIGTSETALSYATIGLSGASAVISLITISRSALDLYFLRDNNYDRALNREAFLLTSFNGKLRKPVAGSTEENPKTLESSIPEDIREKVKEVALEFLKFNDKARYDYIFAFAIKLLEHTQDTALIKDMMKAVMTSTFLGETPTPNTFIASDAAIENYLYLTFKILRVPVTKMKADLTLPPPAFSQAPSPRVVLQGSLPESITDNEEAYLKLLDPIQYTDEHNVQHAPGLLSGAVQDLLQKLNKKAELEKAPTEQLGRS